MHADINKISIFTAFFCCLIFNCIKSYYSTRVQLYNKIANLKRIVFPSEKIANSHDLRQRVAANLEVPEDELEGYVIDHEIDDEKEEEDPRFTIIFSTRKNMSKLRSDRVFQLDATYRLNWNGFPVFVGGKC